MLPGLNLPLPGQVAARGLAVRVPFMPSLKVGVFMGAAGLGGLTATQIAAPALTALLCWFGGLLSQPPPATFSQSSSQQGANPYL